MFYHHSVYQCCGIHQWFLIYSGLIHTSILSVLINAQGLPQLSCFKYIQSFINIQCLSAVTHFRCFCIYPWVMFFSHTAMPSSLQPHELQPTRLPCPSLSPGICSYSCPLRQLCQQSTIWFSVTPIPTYLQSYTALVSFLMIWLFASCGQTIATSASVLPISSQCWFPLGLTGLSSLQLKGLKSLLQHHSSKTSITWHSTFFMVQISHPCMTTG